MGDVKIKLHTFQTLELDGSEWSASHSDSLVAGEENPAPIGDVSWVQEPVWM
jgi:hypothetical protein